MEELRVADTDLVTKASLTSFTETSGQFLTHFLQ
jgi:hypothetical protein